MDQVYVRQSEIEAAFARLREMIQCGKETKDSEYFALHEPRYRHGIERVCAICPRGAHIVDIGSHFLHQASILKLLGFDVLGLDVPKFTTIDFVSQRAQQMQIENVTVPSLAEGSFLEEKKPGELDCVLFTEILEHITFNPIRFWHQVYRLLKVGGIIYITTPNSLRLVNLVSAIKRAVTLSGIGQDIAAIFSNVTYGHHWKEYSATEVVRYFSLLSPDFSLDVSTYAYRPRDRPLNGKPAQLIKSAIRESTRRFGNRTQIFGEELEVVVKLSQRTVWSATLPSYS